MVFSHRTFALTALTTVVTAQQFHLAQDYSGSNFFNGFKYNESAIDFNNFGNVHFLGQSAAEAAGLTSVNSNGQAIIKVDNSTNAAGDVTFGRNSVYLMSNQLMTIGSLLVFDAAHIPFGCSVWPALFTQGQIWPQQGEIDIIENVNLATQNQYSLHSGVTAGTCMHADNNNQTGRTTSANCTVVPENNQNTGCVTQDTSSNSFGQGFASNGGGVYATLWDDNGVTFWFFERTKVPSGIDTNPDPSTWSTPAAFYPASGCNPTSVFGPQIITLYIDICGAFAGNDDVFRQTCGSAAPNCSSMVADPNNYNEAYWEINYLRVYTTNSSVTTTAPSSGSATGAAPGAGQTGGGSGSGNDNSGLSLSAVGSLSSITFMSTLALFFGIAALL